MSKRDRRSVLTIGLLLGGLAVGLFLRTIAPPETVRLLPTASGIVYLDLRPLRVAGILGKGGIAHDQDYQQFIDATQFEFERDLDEAAFALSPLPPESGLRRVGFSEVFSGRFDTPRLTAYLNHLAAQTEQYHNHKIYEIPFQGRTVRACILAASSVAVSNMPTSKDLYTILDRHDQPILSALPVGQDPLLLGHYHSVPLASVVWGILRLKSAPGDDGLDLHLPGGYGMLFPPQTVLVASSRYMGGIQLRAEAFTANDTDAKQIVSNVDTLLSLLRSVDASVHPAGMDRDVRDAFSSMRVEQNGSRAVFLATLPTGFLNKLFSDAQERPQSASSGRP